MIPRWNVVDDAVNTIIGDVKMDYSTLMVLVIHLHRRTVDRSVRSDRTSSSFILFLKKNEDITSSINGIRTPIDQCMCA